MWSHGASALMVRDALGLLPLEGTEIKRDVTRKDLCVALEHVGYCICQSLGSLAGSFMSPGVCFSKQQIGVYPLGVGIWDADHHHT